MLPLGLWMSLPVRGLQFRTSTGGQMALRSSRVIWHSYPGDSDGYSRKRRQRDWKSGSLAFGVREHYQSHSWWSEERCDETWKGVRVRSRELRGNRFAAERNAGKKGEVQEVVVCLCWCLQGPLNAALSHEVSARSRT